MATMDISPSAELRGKRLTGWTLKLVIGDEGPGGVSGFGKAMKMALQRE